MNHNEYPKSLERKTEAELLFIARDCKEALEANPTSAKANDYQAEILYVAAELKRRRFRVVCKGRTIAENLREKTADLVAIQCRREGTGIATVERM